MSETRENRRSEILKAACTEFSENGYDSTKMEQIAKRVGIGKSTIYEYFPSKNELLKASCEWIFGTILCDVDNIMQKDICFKDKVINYIKHACDILSSIGSGMMILYGKSDSVQIIRSNAGMFHMKLLDIIEKAVFKAVQNGEIRENINPRNIAKIITFLPSPILCEEIKNNGDAALDDIISILIYGLAKQIFDK